MTEASLPSVGSSVLAVRDCDEPPVVDDCSDRSDSVRPGPSLEPKSSS